MVLIYKNADEIQAAPNISASLNHPPKRDPELYLVSCVNLQLAPV